MASLLRSVNCYSFSCCCCPVQCSVSWEILDAFWESLGHGCTIRTITWLSQVLFFILLCCVRIELCVLKSLTCQKCTETIPSVECQWKWQFRSPLPFPKTWELNCFSVKGVTLCLSCGIPWWVGGRTLISCGCDPTPACASFQVHEQTRDERPGALRSYDHHECRYFSLLPERRMVQISILPSIFFLLPIWVSFPLQSKILTQYREKYYRDME